MSKIQLFRNKMKEASVDAVVIFNELNQHYLSDFAFTDGFLLITKEEAYLATDFRYYEMATKKASPDFKIVTPENRWTFISEVLSNNGCRNLGFEGEAVSFSLHKLMSDKLIGIELTDVGEMVETLRLIKTPDEIATMQRAQDITDRAFTHILKMLNYNMTELEVACELEYFMRKAGADSVAFDTIAVSGDASSLPHGTPRPVKLKNGFLTMDYGAKLDGYCSDMTRTVVIGKADADIKKLYNTVLDAQTAALNYLSAGADCGEADKKARDIIDAEYKGAFGHSLGHGVGLLVHENPRLSARSFGRKLVAGEVVTCEPGIYLFGKYGCRIEDMVAITDGGIYNFTHSTKELIEI